LREGVREEREEGSGERKEDHGWWEGDRERSGESEWEKGRQGESHGWMDGGRGGEGERKLMNGWSEGESGSEGERRGGNLVELFVRLKAHVPASKEQVRAQQRKIKQRRKRADNVGSKERDWGGGGREEE
jgi:hypothetical protein